MEIEIEFLSRNIMSNNIYDAKTKTEYISMINRITKNDIIIKQLIRSMDYNILYNTLNEEIKYLSKQLEYFSKYSEIKDILTEYIYSIIRSYNKIINNL